MNQRKINRQSESRTRLHIPKRNGVQVGKTPLDQPSRATIPLLDEKEDVFTTPLALRPLFWLGRKLKKAPKRSLAIIGLVLIVGYIALPHPAKKTTDTTTKKTSGTVTKLSRNETPKFDTVVPDGKSIKDYGGWTRISPPDRVPVFAYSDKIGDVTINVSQQELPENLRDNGEELEKLSADFNADKKLTVGDITAYIGTSAKGPQSVIFIKDNLLVLIKSTAKISDDQWITYISSLN